MKKYLQVCLVVVAGYYLPALIEFPPVPGYYFVTTAVSVLIAFLVMEIQVNWLSLSIALIEIFCIVQSIYGILENANKVPVVYVLYYMEDILQAAFFLELILLAMGAPPSNVIYNRLVPPSTKLHIPNSGRVQGSSRSKNNDCGAS